MVDRRGEGAPRGGPLVNVPPATPGLGPAELGGGGVLARDGALLLAAGAGALLAAGAGAGGGAMAALRFCMNSSVCMITGGGDATGALLNCSKAALASAKTWGFAVAPGRVCASTS